MSMMPSTSAAAKLQSADIRERVLRVASELFYAEGARAVGVDLVVERAGVAKTSLYRHFRTKDDLIAAFLEAEDRDFWTQWDSVAAEHAGDAMSELEAHMRWIAGRVARPNYRGCPQLNMAAEFPDAQHPARIVAVEHKRQLRIRLERLAERLDAAHGDQLAAQLLVLINGAFVSSQTLCAREAEPVLLGAARAFVAAAGKATDGR